MTDIRATINRYVDVCTGKGRHPSQFVRLIMDIEQERQFATDQPASEEYRLHLAGNNRLVCDTNSERLTDEDVADICEALETNFFVRQLDLSYNRITDTGAKSLAKLLLTNASISYLNLTGNDITSQGCPAIAEALQENQVLRALILTGNKIERPGGYAIAQALQVNQALTHLTLSDCDIEHDSIIALATVLKYNSTVKSLNISRPLLTTRQEEPTVHIADMLKFNSTLEALYMDKFGMTDTGFTRLCESLVNNIGLLHLSVRCNRLTRDSAKAVEKVLQLNTPLKSLHLSNNRLGSPGAEILANVLGSYNTSLECLELRYNELDSQGICALADNLKANVTLQRLYLWGNDLSEPGSIAIASLLEHGRLREDDTDVRPYVVDGVTILAELSNKPHRDFYDGGTYFGDSVPPENQPFADWYWQKVHSIRKLAPYSS